MFNNFSKGLYFQSDGAAAGGAAGGAGGSGEAGQANGQGGETPSFEEFIAKQPDNIKGLFESHTKGLRSALESERETRKGFEKQIRELAAKAEKGSDAEKQLLTIGEQLSSVDRKATFYEEAHAAGVTNLKLAYVVASTDELFDKKGNVNFADMKTKYPELFGVRKAPKGDAAEGTEGQLSANSMNDVIRRMAGKK